MDQISIALQFQDHLSRLEIDEALSLVAPDFQHVGPDGSVADVAALRALFSGLRPMLQGRIVMNLVGSTVQDERVALEMTGSAELANGRTYHNRYHFLFVVQDGLIHRIHEYCDITALQAFA